MNEDADAYLVDPYDDNDNVILFVETELGRYDAYNNWQTYRQSRDFRARIQSWMGYYGIDGDVGSFINKITAFIDSQKGKKWSWDCYPQK